MRIPGRIRTAGHWAQLQLRSAQPEQCVLPDFLIVGAMKSGTTSVFNYLRRHPQVLAPSKKEIRFFDRHHCEGLSWYQEHFPHKIEVNALRILRRSPVATGEASPSYMFYPGAIDRIHRSLPSVKLIALLRDPVDRAYSHYMHNVRRNREDLTFEQAIERESDRIQGDLGRLATDDCYVALNLIYYSYVSRGMYADQIQRMRDVVGEDRLLVLASEDLFQNTVATYDRITDFLGLDRVALRNFVPRNVGSYVPTVTDTHRHLEEVYTEPNRRLFSILGRRFDWRGA